MINQGKRKRITVLGSTGSVGKSTLDLIKRASEDFVVTALTGRHNIDLLAEQAKCVRPSLVVTADEALYLPLKEKMSGTGIAVAAGGQAVIEAAQMDSELIVAGIVGVAGLAATVAAIRSGATVAFANKECLISAGSFLMTEVERCKASLLPIDSEHNAIFQVLDKRQTAAVQRLILTASGGPFRCMPLANMASVTPDQAISHPNWSMGAKISVDSATMMNKGLEIIEAFHLFNVPYERIEVLVHPQSIIHSMVAYIDGSILAQLGLPDMRTPIAYALAYPDRMAAPLEPLDFAAMSCFTFEAPDTNRFPALELCRAALREGNSAPTILNAANEVAVAAFLARRIGFLDITRIVEEVLTSMSVTPICSLEDVLSCDQMTREAAERRIAKW